MTLTKNNKRLSFLLFIILYLSQVKLKEISILKDDTFASSVTDIFPKINTTLKDQYDFDNDAIFYSDWQETQPKLLPNGLNSCSQGKFFKNDNLLTTICKNKTFAIFEYKKNNKSSLQLIQTFPLPFNSTSISYALGVNQTFYFITTNENFVSNIFFLEKNGSSQNIEINKNLSKSSQIIYYKDFLITFQKKYFYNNFEETTDFIILTKINKEDFSKSKSEFIYLNIKTGFVINFAKILDLKIENLEFRITFRSLYKNDSFNNNSLALCLFDIENLRFSKCEVLELDLDFNYLPINPLWALNKNKTNLTIAGKANNLGIEVLNCEMNPQNLKASNCVYNKRTVSNLKEKLQVFNLDSSGVITYRKLENSENADYLDYDAQLVYNIKRFEKKIEFASQENFQARNLFQIEESSILVLKSSSFFYYTRNVSNANFVVKGIDLPPKKSTLIKITKKQIGIEAYLKIQVELDLNSSFKLPLPKELPSIPIFRSESDELPIYRESFKGNALKFSMTSSEEDCSPKVLSIKTDDFWPIFSVYQLPKNMKIVDFKFIDTEAFILAKDNNTNEYKSYHAYSLSDYENKWEVNRELPFQTKEDNNVSIDGIYNSTDFLLPGIIGIFRSSKKISFIFYNSEKRMVSIKIEITENIQEAHSTFFFQGQNALWYSLISYPKKNLVVAYVIKNNGNFKEKYDFSLKISKKNKNVPFEQNFCPKYINRAGDVLEIVSECENQISICRWIVERKIKFLGAVQLDNIIHRYKNPEKNIQTCSIEEDMIIYDKTAGKIYGRSFKDNLTFFSLRLEELGIKKITDFFCITSLEVMIIIGSSKNKAKKLVATYYLPSSKRAHSRVHSLLEIPNNIIISPNPYNIYYRKIKLIKWLESEDENLMDKEGNKKLGIKENVLDIYLDGPFFNFEHKYFIKNCNNFTIHVSNFGNRSSELVYDKIVLDDEISDLVLDFKSAKPQKIESGFNNFEKLAKIRGHVFKISFDQDPPPKEWKVSLIPRLNMEKTKKIDTKDFNYYPKNIIDWKSSKNYFAIMKQEFSLYTKIIIFNENLEFNYKLGLVNYATLFEFIFTERYGFFIGLKIYDGCKYGLKVVSFKNGRMIYFSEFGENFDKMSSNHIHNGKFIIALWNKRVSKVRLLSFRVYTDGEDIKEIEKFDSGQLNNGKFFYIFFNLFFKS